MQLPHKSKIDQVEWAFEYQNSTEISEINTYIHKKTGEIVCDDEDASGEPCPIDDIEDHPDYLHLPDKYELDLGQRLVWRFVRQEIPGLEPKIREIFSRRGAYSRWKDFLSNNDLLDKWHDFENNSTRQALLDWCAENGIPMDDASLD
jgi:hypothetical protein